MTGTTNAIEANSPEAHGRLALCKVLDRMPYAGSLHPRPTLDLTQTNEMFIVQVAHFLNDLALTLGTVATTAQGMRDELDQLRRERAAIRSFFGTNQIGEQ